MSRRVNLLALLITLLSCRAGDIPITPRSAGFASAASLNTARSQHTATLLSNGNVLVVGGEADGGTTLLSAEVYDSTSDKWTLAASLNSARKRHTATRLADGTVLVAGGLSDSGTVSSAEVYDPVANTWTTTSSMSATRQSHTATVLPNGKVLVAGGAKQTTGSPSASVTALNTTEIYDPSSSAWIPAPNMSKAHYFHSAILLANNKVLVASGAFSQTIQSTTTTPNAELYDYIQNTWTLGGTLAFGRAQAVIAPVTFGRVLVTGGLSGTNRLSSAELYDSQTIAWSGTGALAQLRTLHTGTLLNSGLVFVAAGFDGSNVLNSAEVYDPIAATWSSAGTLAAARQYHTATLLGNGNVLLVGGTNQIALSSTEIFNPGASSGPLTLDSNVSASPNPAKAGQTATFSASATGGTGTLTYTWSFGDGASGSGSSVTHTYATEGTFGASVTVTDSASASVSGSVTVTIAGIAQGVVVGVGADSDEDGFSNVVEQIMGSDPNDSNALPLDVTNVNAPLPLQVARLQTTLRFNRGNRDSISLVGLLPLPSGFVPAGTKIGVDVNGVAYLAHLNERGASGSVFKLSFTQTNGNVPAQSAFFTVNLSGGTYSPAFASAGLKNGDFKKRTAALTVSILFGTKLYQASVPQIYSARLNLHGVSRKP
ncbi:MAG: kelch repeat-containing protein [Planctomycetota bacterium]